MNWRLRHTYCQCTHTASTDHCSKPITKFTTEAAVVVWATCLLRAAGVGASFTDAQVAWTSEAVTSGLRPPMARALTSLSRIARFPRTHKTNLRPTGLSSDLIAAGVLTRVFHKRCVGVSFKTAFRCTKQRISDVACLASMSAVGPVLSTSELDFSVGPGMMYDRR